MTELHREGAERDAPLAPLIAARICHDIVSPLGAIANGVELLGLTSGPSPEMDLIAESVASATARVRFFRLAYGPANPGAVASRSEIVGTLAAVARGSRMTYEWRAAGDPLRADVRAVFLLLQCLETAMPQGGQITVARDGGAWVVEGISIRLQAEGALWGALAAGRPAPPASAAQVQFALLPGALEQAGRRLTLTIEPRRIGARL